MAKWVFGFIALCFMALSLWAIKPFIDMDKPIAVNIPQAEILETLSEKTYEPPSDFVAGKAYRLARAKRIMASEASYPVDSILRYNNALEKYMDEVSGRKADDEVVFPQWSDLRSQKVFLAMMKQGPCQGVQRTFVRRGEKRQKGDSIWIAADKYGQDSFGRDLCKTPRSDAYMSKHLQALVDQNLSVKISDCTWERISQDTDILDMLSLYEVQSNAAYLCLITLQSKARKPFETAGYFAQLNQSKWVYLGGFPDVRVKMRNVYLDPAILKNPEAAARMRWTALQ